MIDALEAPLPTQVVRSPEGVDLRLPTAAASERLVALAIDLAIVLVLFLLGLLLGWSVFGAGPVLLWFFLLRHGYFLYCETRGRGTTPGKRRLHLRVIRADGGPLTTEILLARNLTREIELFLPLVLVLNPDVLFAEHEGLVRTLAGLWGLALLFFPLCNPQRLRIGDLLAGTRVVVSPPVVLARDLADQRPQHPAGDPVAEFVFAPAQLTIYGEHELTVLEDVLRKSRSEVGDQALATVAKSIARKIGWGDPPAPGKELRFLEAFYKAQRHHLEQQLLFGKRRLSKRSRAGEERKRP